MRVNGNLEKRVEMELNITQEELMITACQISDKQYWNVYNGTFEDDKIHGEGILELINGSCVFGEFANGQLHGQLTYECIISK